MTVLVTKNTTNNTMYSTRTTHIFIIIKWNPIQSLNAVFFLHSSTNSPTFFLLHLQFP